MVIQVIQTAENYALSVFILEEFLSHISFLRDNDNKHIYKKAPTFERKLNLSFFKTIEYVWLDRLKSHSS